MTEKGKKPGTEAGESDPLSATGMFLNAFGTPPEPPVEQLQEHPAKGAIKPAPPGEFTQMFQKLEPPPSPPPPQARSTNNPPQEPGEFTRTFVAAATHPGLRPDPAPFAPPATPKMRGFSAPGISDSASAEGSFTQLFQTPPSRPAPAAPSPPRAEAPAWPLRLDPVPNEDRIASGGLTQLFRSLSDQSEPAPESPLVNHSASPARPPVSDPGSVTMLIQRLTEDLEQAAAPTLITPLPAAPAAAPEAGEFTRIMEGGATRSAAPPGVAAGLAVAAGSFAMPVAPAPALPAAPVPAFAAPQVPALAVPAAPPPQAAPSAPPGQSKLQQMLPMLLVLNAFLVVVLILLLVFALKSR